MTWTGTGSTCTEEDNGFSVIADRPDSRFAMTFLFGDERMNVRKMVQSSLFASLMAVCAWISLPVPPVAVTLQTFAVLLALGVQGGKWGTASIVLYLAMGFVGLPVFAGFRGGIAALLDATGGFLWGFLAGGLVYWLTEKLGNVPAMVLCQLTCYLCGCLWFSVWAADAGLAAAAMTCVVPYLIPDALKLWLARSLSCRIGRGYTR